MGVSAAVATALAARYPLANFNSPSEALGALGTDIIFACNARVATTALAATVPTYQYEFNDPNAPQRFFSGVSFPTGAYHAAEIQFIFPTSTNPFSRDQQQLSRAMVSYWAHFAWFSTPNGFDTAHWPKFDATGQQDQLLAPGAQRPVTTFKADHQCAA